MSWFSNNYEKAALGGAVVVALGLAYLGWSKFGGIDEDFGAGLKVPFGSGSSLQPLDIQAKLSVSHMDPIEIPPGAANSISYISLSKHP